MYNQQPYQQQYMGPPGMQQPQYGVPMVNVPVPPGAG